MQLLEMTNCTSTNTSIVLRLWATCPQLHDSSNLYKSHFDMTSTKTSLDTFLPRKGRSLGRILSMPVQACMSVCLNITMTNKGASIKVKFENTDSVSMLTCGTYSKPIPWLLCIAIHRKNILKLLWKNSSGNVGVSIKCPEFRLPNEPAGEKLHHHFTLPSLDAVDAPALFRKLRISLQ